MKELERKNFVVNVLTNNEIIDKQKMKSQSRTLGKVREVELKAIYKENGIKAINEIKHIKYDIIQQAFRKKMEVTELASMRSPLLSQDDPSQVQTASQIDLIGRAKKQMAHNRQKRYGSIHENYDETG